MRQITVNQRHLIISLANTLELDLKDLEFRGSGIRYKYWTKVDDLVFFTNQSIIPCVTNIMEDSDCGKLYYLMYTKHYDKDFPECAHSVRYEKPQTKFNNGYHLAARKNWSQAKVTRIYNKLIPSDKQKTHVAGDIVYDNPLYDKGLTKNG